MDTIRARWLCLLIGFSLLMIASLPQSLHAQDEQATISNLLVDVEWLADRLDDPSVVVLHVARSDDHYLAGHVPGARFVRLGDLLESRDEALNVLPAVEYLEGVFSAVGVSNNHHVVVYGEGLGLAAARAFLTLDLLGHERVSVLDGGLHAWQAADLPLSRERAEPVPATFTAQLRADRLVDADWIHRRLNEPGVALVDARPAAQYTGEIAGRDIERPGHIPGAVNLFWQQALVSDENPVLRDADELRSLYEDASIGPDQTVVTYCRTGMQASHAYFMARYLGFEAVLYDPSFFEWSNHTSYPVRSLVD